MPDVFPRSKNAAKRLLQNHNLCLEKSFRDWMTEIVGAEAVEKFIKPSKRQPKEEGLQKTYTQKQVAKAKEIRAKQDSGRETENLFRQLDRAFGRRTERR